MELEHQTQENHVLSSALERHHLGICEMLRGVAAFKVRVLLFLFSFFYGFLGY